MLQTLYQMVHSRVYWYQCFCQFGTLDRIVVWVMFQTIFRDECARWLPCIRGENDWWNNPAPLAYPGGSEQRQHLCIESEPEHKDVQGSAGSCPPWISPTGNPQGALHGTGQCLAKSLCLLREPPTCANDCQLHQSAFCGLFDIHSSDLSWWTIERLHGKLRQAYVLLFAHFSRFWARPASCFPTQMGGPGWVTFCTGNYNWSVPKCLDFCFA